MRILQISDTHNKHLQLTNLPAADVIVHCGDFTLSYVDISFLQQRSLSS